jgi:hypothetical protein
MVDPQLHDTIAKWFAVTKVTRLYSRQSSANAGLARGVTKSSQPVIKRRFTGRADVGTKLKHGIPKDTDWQ